ncbi:MAG: sodium:proton antiporter [Oscillospiraceae bacterium]|nr:sodium:proton antiporter [Oscillospiraceae bacterium]
MADMIYNGFVVVMLIVLALVVFGYFIRTILGPHFSDRMLAVNSISTVVMLFICFIAVMQGENYIIDIALIYAVLGFISVVILCKAYLRSHDKEKANDLKNLKEQVEKIKGEAE